MKILMVCLGNICRSPMAQGIMESKLQELGLYDWQVDSAGTSGWHDGEPPDLRAIQESKKNGVDISKQISRKISNYDLESYDLIFAMDQSNYASILDLCENELQKSKVKLLLNYKYPDKNMAVPDPYYDGSFSKVFNLLDEAMIDIILKIKG